MNAFSFTYVAWMALLKTSDTENFSDTSLISILVVSLVLITALITARILVRKKVTRLMMVKSDLVKPDLAEPEIHEIKATSTPSFEVFTAASMPYEATQARKARIKKAKSDFRKAYFYDLLAVVGYLMLTLDAVAYKLIAVFYGSLCTWRFLFFRDQFRADHTGIRGFLKSIKDLWLTVAHPAYSQYLAYVVIGISVLLACLDGLTDYSGIDYTNVGLLAAALLHTFLRFRLRQKLRNTPNLKLLVLRVFGIDETAVFTFEGLLKYWRYFGSFFTVVDPSFLRSTVRQTNQVIPVIFITFFGIIFLEVILLDFQVNLHLLHYGIIFPVVGIMGYWFVKSSLKNVENNFIKNQEHLQHRLDGLDCYPRHWNGLYKKFPVMCYDNTWKMAVAAFTQKSQVILMDLRGFSAERKGCEFEINYLFDHASVSKILFLIEHEGLELAQQTMLKAWEYLADFSPNKDFNKPVIQIFQATREDAQDVQAMLDLLLLKAENAAG